MNSNSPLPPKETNDSRQHLSVAELGELFDNLVATHAATRARLERQENAEGLQELSSLTTKFADEMREFLGSSKGLYREVFEKLASLERKLELLRPENLTKESGHDEASFQKILDAFDELGATAIDIFLLLRAEPLSPNRDSTSVETYQPVKREPHEEFYLNKKIQIQLVSLIEGFERLIKESRPYVEIWANGEDSDATKARKCSIELDGSEKAIHEALLILRTQKNSFFTDSQLSTIQTVLNAARQINAILPKEWAEKVVALRSHPLLSLKA